jgi:hypothetical protein
VEENRVHKSQDTRAGLGCDRVRGAYGFRSESAPRLRVSKSALRLKSRTRPTGP